LNLITGILNVVNVINPKITSLLTSQTLVKVSHTAVSHTRFNFGLENIFLEVSVTLPFTISL